MSDEKNLPPLVAQAAMTAAPIVTFIGLPAWALSLILGLFDIDAGFEIAAVMAVVLPIAVFLFARLCVQYSLIRPDASPVAIAVLQTAAAAAALWLRPLLPDGSPTGGGGGTSGGGLGGVLMAAIVMAGGWIALALFSHGRVPDVAPGTVTGSETVQDNSERARDPRRLPP